MDNKYKNLYALYKGPGGRDAEMNDMQKLEQQGVLVPGTLYKVTEIDMGSSYTSVKLLNVPYPLNSVVLDFCEITKKGIVTCDIYKDARFNPYMEGYLER